MPKINKWVKGFICLGVMVFASMSIAETIDNEREIVNSPWSYAGETGPAVWQSLNPDYQLCAKGKQQSPINISKRVARTPATLSLHYEPAEMNIINDGLTDLIMGSRHLSIADGHGIQLNFPAEKTKEAIMLDDNLYRLIQIHIHTPAEHKLQGDAAPMEVHLVHQGNNGKVVVLAVLVQSGPKSVVFQKIVNHLPEDKAVEHTVEGEMINPLSFIPKEKSYYNYYGSLTVPPCSENVEWILMVNPVNASSSQINQLSKLVAGNNARPVQPLKQRRIYYSRK